MQQVQSVFFLDWGKDRTLHHYGKPNPELITQGGVTKANYRKDIYMPEMNIGELCL